MIIKITSPDDQLTMITNHLSKLFASDDQLEQNTPLKIEPKYFSKEIEGAIKKLKNNKATGRDEMHDEFIKYRPSDFYHQIAQLLNTTSETGNYPKEIGKEDPESSL